MLTRTRSSRRGAQHGLIVGCLGRMVFATLAGAQKTPIKKLTLDPNAKEVDLFDGIEEGLVSAKMIARDSTQANVFIENKGKEPLTVKFPEAVVGVNVLKQFGGGMGMGGMGGGMGGMGGGMGGMGGGQMMGGGMGGMGGGMGGMGMGGMGGGMFSIPPEKVVQVPLKTVCLEHGKPDPRPRMTYQIVPLESKVSDSKLQAFLKMFGTGKIDQHTAQAAAWHLSSHMSWEELAAKTDDSIGSAPTPYFDLEELQGAQKLVAMAADRAAREPKDKAAKPTPAARKSPGKGQ